MKSLFLFIAFLLTQVKVYAQETVALRAVGFDAGVHRIHVADVLDDRDEQYLGTHKNPNGNEVKLYLDKGAASSIKQFYAISLPHQEHSKPIYIKILALNVQESKRRMNDGIARIARAHIDVVFLEKNGGKLHEVFSIKHNEDQVFGLEDKQGLYVTHEKRIRAALEYCMLAFLNNYQVSDQTTNHFTKPEEGYVVDTKLGQWFNLVTIKGMRSSYFEGYGISYTGFVDNKKGLIKPYEASFEVTWARPGIAAENGFKDVNSFVFRPELYFIYKRLARGIYGSLSANIPIGYEILEDFEQNNSFNFVIGLGASQGIRCIPWEKQGIVFGVDFFQQFETSKVYSTDFGVELVLGINF
ncbi:hypothetical protein FNH22_28450 [Fulvivirga sp. M361]|uniref:hypothetical protein n=1 Tax=Fulvivirga sp. M361 TaxID=2594266 RepID=UPI00117B7C63|nr:hypothetical protein [Fulvivirga sp. M361]TRX48696.1 hypothetical protein FNH22_28450 [Fulvivirga sp. M361]